MMKPLSRVVCKKLDLHPLHRVHKDRILQDPSLGRKIRVDYLEKVTVQVHGMGHHAAVTITDSYTVTGSDGKRLRVRIELPIDGPQWRVHASA